MRQIIKSILLTISPSLIKKRVFANYQSLQWKCLAKSDLDAELLIMEFLLHKDSVFFDVGANKGEYAYCAEKLIGSNHIFLFEPEKKLFKQLKAIFKNCRVFDIALSDTKGTHSFKTPVINGIADNCLSSLEIENKEDNETEALVYNVKTDTLDNFIRDSATLPDLIKIDVEGHELAVLKGGENYISSYHPTLIIELEQRHHRDIKIESVFESFKVKGYNAYYYSKKQSQLILFENKTHLTNTKEFFGTLNYINNYIFIHSTNKTIKDIEAINHEISLKIKS